ncbi:cytochrome d ubiquinol oxidase subunit II [Paludisphaera mucosa]|uniref:Cytochrome d ubiquinol oxidase subunit II n=1 Tax=Paludisphaera mucosa TaxID=3030827 RepID=A0ABT6F8F0_9BACT|nr:cytochrome d ubiquinol oxidase subunit II [Paludisphaera mucosa]MDG3003864.1 cytochrome d ubiquinol oxidase subunit II [Paludisphaera mucosa]
MGFLTTISPAEGVAAVMLLALIAYALLGGADYGAGVWDLMARGPRAQAQRDLIAHAIGPVWEANHVWLIIIIVLLFTGFPAAFTAVMTTLHVPLSLLLIGIVLRGSAFTFRSYDATELARRRWNRVFSIPSVVTPVLLGAVIGAIATGEPGRAAEAGGAAPLFATWLRPFPLAVGLFALNLFAYLAAVYLTLETDDPALQEDFRFKALVSAVTLGAVAWLVYFLAGIEAPLVHEGLSRSSWGASLRYATGAMAITAIAALWLRWYSVARLAAMFQAAMILWGAGTAQFPYLVPPHFDMVRGAAPRLVHQLLLIALGCGSVVLIPSLIYLFRVFKGHTFRADLAVASAAEEGPVNSSRA